MFPSRSSSHHTTEPWQASAHQLKANPSWLPSPTPLSAKGDPLAAEAAAPNVCQCKVRSLKGEMRRRTGQQLTAQAEEDSTVCTPLGSSSSTGACPSGLCGWFNKKAGKVCLSSCDKTAHVMLCDCDRQRRHSAPSAEVQLFHKALQATGSAEGNYCILGVEFPDLTTLLKHNRGLQK